MRASALIACVIVVGGIARADDEPRATVKGELPREAVDSVIASHADESRICFAKALATKPDLFGRVTVEVTVGGDGRVKLASVASTTLKDSGVQTCLVEAMGGWIFPSPADGKDAVVTYPFHFKGVRGYNPDGGAHLDKSELTAILHDRSDDIRQCYDAARKKQPTLEGRVEVRFTIDQTGRVTSSVVTGSTVKEHVLEKCIADAVGKWQFPKPHGDGLVVVTYPFNLHLAPAPPPPPVKPPAPAPPPVAKPAVDGGVKS